jgi:hypothetical protein
MTLHSTDRKLQLDAYNKLTKTSFKKKRIDIMMEAEVLFKNLVLDEEESNRYHDATGKISKFIYKDARTGEFIFEYQPRYAYNDGSIMCSHRVRLLFKNMGITEKKSESYVRAIVNRLYNISRAKYFAYFVNC